MALPYWSAARPSDPKALMVSKFINESTARPVASESASFHSRRCLMRQLEMVTVTMM